MKNPAAEIRHSPFPFHRDCQRKMVSMSLSRQMCSKHCTAARRGAHLLIVSLVGFSFSLSLYLPLPPSLPPFPLLLPPTLSLSLFVRAYVRTYMCYAGITISHRGRTRSCQKCIDPACNTISRANILPRRRISLYKAPRIRHRSSFAAGIESADM